MAVLVDSEGNRWITPLPERMVGMDVETVGLSSFPQSNHGPAGFAKGTIPVGQYLLEWHDDIEAAKLVPIKDIRE